MKRRSSHAVDAAFARDYGEGDRTLEWWHAEGAPYYADLAGRTEGDTVLICERFRVVYVERPTQ